MKHSNISIFIPHIGCPHQCSFCNQRTISGKQHAPSGDEVQQICTSALAEAKSPENSEIAFFGGSFTAIPHEYMMGLLEAVQPFIGVGKFRGIRISTRPDCINNDVLSLLKTYGVTSIELGAQSMSDKVLEANERGHSAADVEKASRLIREYGFELGLQMMVGLYKSSGDDEWETMEKIVEIHPDTVRIYPVVILKGTKLAEIYESGEYELFCGSYEKCGFDDVIEAVAVMMETFEKNGIKVIKCGLHASEFVERDMIGGFYHPAFREICEGHIYRRRMENIITEDYIGKTLVFAVNPSCISKAMGHKKANAEYFGKSGITIKIIGDENIPKYKVELRR